MRRLKYKSNNLYLPGIHNLISCEFQVDKFRSDGTITYRGPWFKNTILDVGLDLFADDDLYRITRYCNVGTGSSTPSTGQSGLDSYLASAEGYIGSGGSPGPGPDTYSVTHHTTNTDPLHFGREETIEFGIGTCTGNITEVGLSRLSNDKYFNRQLFRDEFGDPITISVDSDEGLRVTFDIKMYSTMSRETLYSGSFDLDGSYIGFDHQINHEIFNSFDDSPYSRCIHRKLNGKNVLGSIGSETSAIVVEDTNMPSTSQSSQSIASYAASSFYRDTTLVWAPNDFSGDVNRLVIGYDGSGSYEGVLSTFLLDSTISILDTEEFSVTIRRSWGRYVAS